MHQSLGDIYYKQRQVYFKLYSILVPIFQIINYFIFKHRIFFRQFDIAIISYNRLIELQPDSPDAYFHKANALNENEQVC